MGRPEKKAAELARGHKGGRGRGIRHATPVSDFFRTRRRLMVLDLSLPDLSSRRDQKPCRSGGAGPRATPCSPRSAEGLRGRTTHAAHRGEARTVGSERARAAPASRFRQTPNLRGLRRRLSSYAEHPAILWAGLSVTVVARGVEVPPAVTSRPLTNGVSRAERGKGAER